MDDVPTLDFTLDDWLEELEVEEDEGREALTRKELQDVTGLSKDVVLRELRRINDEGRLVVARKKVMAIDGRMSSVPAYKLKGKKNVQNTNTGRQP